MLATRPRGSEQRQFLVRWSGYCAEDDSWEDEANILDRKMIKAFDRATRHALPQPERAATSAYLARRVTQRSRIGTAHQVAELPEARELVSLHRGAQCGCARCVALVAASGNGTAAHAPPCAPPRCHCGAPAAWVRQLFWCEKGNCDFEWRPCYRPEPTRLGVSEIEASLASSTAALLTASAFGPMNAWCCISFTSGPSGPSMRNPRALVAEVNIMGLRHLQVLCLAERFWAWPLCPRGPALGPGCERV